MNLFEHADGTMVRYDYEVAISGKVASVGGRMLDGAARTVIGGFFKALVAQAGSGGAKKSEGLMVSREDSIEGEDKPGLFKRIFGGGD